MLRRGLAFCLALSTASVVQAGATIELVPTKLGAPAPGPYTGGEVITVEVYLRQDVGGSDELLRFVQLDVDNSSPDFFRCAELDGCLAPPATHSGTTQGLIRVWVFDDVPMCVTDSADCGAGHFLEQVLNGPRPNVVSSTYYFTDPVNVGLGPDPLAQRTLPGDNATRLLVAKIAATMPAADGVYTLDVANAGESNPDLGGADVRFGFGLDPGDPLTTWRAFTGELAGGTLEMQVGQSLCEDLTGTTPACDTTLSKMQDNVVRLTFGGPVGLPAPGQIQIWELDAAGAMVGSDLSGSFLYSLESGGTVLRIQENGTVFNNEAWYTILNDSWADACSFDVTYVVVKGNANNDSFTDFGDLSFCFANQTGSAADDDPCDVNSDGFVDFGDLSAAFSFNGSAKPARPPVPACP